MLEDAELHLVETLDEAQAFLSWLGERRPVLGLDTETTGLRPYATDHLRLVQFGDARTGWAVSYRNWRGLIEQALGQYDGPVALHNANFDLHFLAQAGLPLPPLHRLHDTMLMDHLLDPMRAHGLKAVGERLWPGSGAGQFELDNDMRRNKWTWATVPENLRSYWVYSAWDPVLTARVAENLWPQIHERGLVDQYHREMAVQDIAYRMERKGLLIDPAYTDGLRAEWSTEMHELEAELEALGVGNPSAARQVAQAMQLTENWEPDDWTETGQPKMDEKVLKGIDSEISRRVLRFRRLRKWIGTYLETFLRDRDENDRLHPSIRTLRARTGRMSITGPPMQTLPSAKSGYGYHIRRCIVVPPGKALWAIDYDIQELRLFAHYSGDPAYMEAFAGGRDLHSYIAQLVYQDPTIGKGDQRREIAKNCMVPGTRVLTRDLRWVPVETLKAGDKILAFDENQNEGSHSRSKMRRVRDGVVTSTGIAIRPTMNVYLVDGTRLTVTDNHMFLVTTNKSNKSVWVEAQHLTPTMEIIKYLNVWDEDTSKDAGWLAGMLDGEGHLTAGPTGPDIGVCQNPGPTSDRLERLLGPKWCAVRTNRNVRAWNLRGTWADRAEFLGSIRPERLVAKFPVGFALQSANRIRIDRVERAPDQPVVLLSTDTETYFSEGFGSHNTGYARLYGAGPDKIADTAGVTAEEVRHFMQTFDATFTRAGEFIKELDTIGRRRLVEEGRPYVVTWGGRTLPADPDRIYALLNYLIQGTAADVLKVKMLELDGAGLGDSMLLPVHDELLFEFDEGDTEGPELARKIMEEHDAFSVPLLCGASGPYPDWGSKYLKE